MVKRIYLMRHAEAESQEKDAKLSERGRFQARHAALKLALDLWESDWPARPKVQFYYSPVGRAVETHQITHDRVRTNPDYFPVELLDSVAEERIQAGGVIGPLMKSGIAYEQTVEHWLRNPECVPGRQPRVIAARLGEFLGDCFERTDDAVIVAITHEIPLAAFLHQMGYRPDACSVRNCEWLRIDFDEKNVQMQFRDRTHYGMTIRLSC